MSSIGGKEEPMVLSKVLRGSPAETKEELTRDTIRNYFLSQPEVFDVSPRELRIGKDGRGRIDIIELPPRHSRERNIFQVTIYDDSPEAARESYDHINQAIEWCLGADAYATYRRLFDPDLRVLTLIPQSEEDISQLYKLALIYFDVLGDEQCVELESQLQNLRAKLRTRINLHVSALR